MVSFHSVMGRHFYGKKNNRYLSHSIRHMWSIRETMKKKIENARENNITEEGLEDALHVLISTIYISLFSKLKTIMKKTNTEDFIKCKCHIAGKLLKCTICKQKVCDYCARFFKKLLIPRQHLFHDKRCKKV